MRIVLGSNFWIALGGMIVAAGTIAIALLTYLIYEADSGGEVKVEPIAVVKDSFNDQSSRVFAATSYQGSNYAIAYEDGWLRVMTSPTYERPALVKVPNGPYENSSISVDALLGGNATDEAAIQCRDGDLDSRGYRLSVMPYDSMFAIFRWDGDKSKTLVDWTSSPQIRRAAVNQIVLSCRGNKITAEINGKVVSTVVDETYKSGDAWFGAAGHNGQAVDAYFDNFVLTEY